MEDIKHFDIISCLPYLNHIETPNGESQEIIKKYNDFIIHLYKNTPNLDIDSYNEKWKVVVGMEDNIGSALKMKFLELEKDSKVMAEIQSLYSKTLDVAKKQLGE